MTLDRNALIGTYEEAYEEDMQAAILKSQAKMITDKKTERLDDFAKDSEIDKKLIKQGYARYKALRNGTLDAADEDFYTVMAAVDEGFAEEEKD
jgi:hypothetical protein